MAHHLYIIYNQSYWKLDTSKYVYNNIVNEPLVAVSKIVQKVQCVRFH